MRNRGAGLAAISCLAAGLALFRWGAGPLRTAGGDVLIVVLLVAVLATFGLGSAQTRAPAVFVFAAAVEAFQGLGLVGADAHWALHLTIGSTFDPWDLLSYALGAGLARTVGERAWRQ